MADDTLERGENQDVGTSPKQLRCRFHETEEYTIFCKDCKDFMCLKCIGQLHQKHELSQVQDADQAIRTVMCGLLLENKYTEYLNSLSDKVSDKEKELVKDEESLAREKRSSVAKMKQNIDLAEKNSLSELRNAFGSYQTSLQDQKTKIKNLQTEIANLDVDKLPEYNLSHVIYSLSELKSCLSTCDKIINHPKSGFQPIMKFSIGKIIQTSCEKSDSFELPLSISSNISTQIDFFQDSDTEWFDAEDREDDNVEESSSDEITDEYPMKFQMKQDIKLISKIVPISEKDA
ncbi:RING finger domain and kelch repeat-containing protein DDB_G0271372-like [Mytilus edulis]|uniref:RING finger domain and kelch repeat-containing protein DDB_G0271372-like n=1 Tax=Mytilus edulis TaxID=6550 RepID=UPI0039F023E2